MKKQILIFLFFSTIAFGQEYKFDKIVKSKFGTDYTYTVNSEEANLFNSNDYSYFMQMYSEKDSLKSRIWDIRTNKIHYFFVNQSDSTKFYYIETHKYEKPVENYSYNFSENKNSKNKNEILLMLFNKNKRIARYKLAVEESSVDLFPVFGLTTMEPFHLLQIKSPSNLKVIIAKGNNISGKNVKYTLTSIQEIDLLLKIEKELLLK